MKPFFIEIPNVWTWTDNLGRYILGHFGYFWPIYQHPFWSMFTINQSLFLQKTKPLYANPKYLFGIGIFEFGPQRIWELAIVCP